MELRSAAATDALAIAATQVDAWQTAYRDIVAGTYLDEMSVESRRSSWEYRLGGRVAIKPATFVVESDPDGVVGFVSGGQNRGELSDYDAELYAISVRPAHQRQGLGRRLLFECAAALDDQGFGRLVLWELATSPVRGFFDSVGGRVVGDRSIRLGDAEYPGVGYGWDDLGVLASQAD
jgi:ribosomal protein S18 acetylase RimI-like enzyme